MSVSSQHIIKSVSKELKYYFDVKRKEDGFDLSGTSAPQLDHPRLRPRATLQYDGLHDKPLKHYFSPREVRTGLTHMKAPSSKKGREKRIQKMVQEYMKRYDFLGRTTPKPSNIPDEYYNDSMNGKKVLRPEYSGGFTSPLHKRKRAFKGGYPLLRAAPPSGISRGEAHRLVNMAAKLLVATETIDLQQTKEQQQQQKNGKEEPSAPQPFETSRKLPNIHNDKNKKEEAKPRVTSGSAGRRRQLYAYDINGRKVPVKRPESKDSAYSTPPDSPKGMYVTIDGQPADDQKVPRWLRKEMEKRDLSSEDKGVENQWVRPHSAYATPTPRPPDEHQATGVRPYSAVVGQGEYQASEVSTPPPASGAWESQSTLQGDETVTVEGSPQPAKRAVRKSTIEVSVQTGGELLKHYDQMEQVIGDGEKTHYEIHVWTGNRLGASTKADIKIILFGDRGRTQEIFLKDSKTHKVKFQKGQEDIFEEQTYLVGQLRKISIGHDRRELGYGWYVDKVEVKDQDHRLSYLINCNHWLSSREGDGLTVREFPVVQTTSFSEEDDKESTTDRSELASAQVSIKPQDKEDKESEDEKSDTGSTHTSLITNPSQKDKTEKQGSVRSSSYESDYDSDTSSSSDSTETTKEDKNKKDDTENDTKVEVKAPLSSRRDDFFDQKAGGKDYSLIVSESLSQTTNPDNKDDFESDKPQYSNRSETEAGGDKGNSSDAESEASDSSADTARLSKGDSEDAKEEEVPTAALSHGQEPPKIEVSQPQKEEKDDYMDGFKAGLEAARRASVSETHKEEDHEESDTEHQAILRGPSIHQAARSGDLDRVKKLVAHNTDTVNSSDERGWSPLHSASAQGCLDVVKWLAVNGANLNADTPTGYSPLHVAAMNGHTNVMMVLAAMGARISCQSVDSQTPLHLAAMSGHIESVKWLVANRASLDMEDNVGRTPLNMAEQYQHDEVAEFLRSCQEEQNNPKSGLALVRRNSKSSLNQEGAHDDKEAKSDKNDITARLEPEKEEWSDDKEPQSSRSKATDDENGNADNETDGEDEEVISNKKHDEELMEKKKEFEKHHENMERQGTSFLDAIRAELEAEEQKQQ